MSHQTRLELIHDFQTQIVYSRTTFPMGTKGLTLHNGQIAPGEEELQQIVTLNGPAIKPGDPMHISYIRIYGDHIHFDLNGGAIHRKKWYQKVQVSGTGGTPVPLGNDQQIDNPHGSYLDLYFDNFVPEMTAAQLRDLLLPVLDFNARNKEQAYLETVSPVAKKAIQEHRVLVGMSTEMVIHAKGRPPKKVRERDGETDYEEWIYGEPPADVDFVRIVGVEVVRVETMRVGGQKIVRTEKEINLTKPGEGDSEAKRDAEKEAEEQEHASKAPSLRRPGETDQDVPVANPAGGTNQAPPMAPPSIPQPPGGGPGAILAGSR